MDPISQICSTQYHAAHNDGARPMPPTLIVIHSTEGGTAAGVARLFTSPKSGGSAQLVVDDNQCFRCLPDSARPWGAPGANSQGLHIELCGFAKWSSDDWRHHEPMLHRAAYKVSLWAKAYRIPATHLTVTELRAGRHGIVTHKDVADAFHLTDHWDPGPGFPMPYFLTLVHGYLDPTPEPPAEVEKHYDVIGSGGQTFGPFNRVEAIERAVDRINAMHDEHKDDPDDAPDVEVKVVRHAKGELG